MNSTAHRFACDGCGKSYALRPEISGRRVKCACGRVMTAPPMPTPIPVAADVEPESELYDVADDIPTARRAGPAPAAPRAVLTTAPPSAETTSAPPPVRARAGVPRQPMSYARGKTAGDSAMDRYFPDRVKDLKLPLALIVGGTVIEVGIACIWRSSGPFSRSIANSVVWALVGLGIYMVLNTLLMLGTCFAVAKLRGISFGPLLTAILKLCALSIGPGAVGSLLSLGLAWMPLGGLLGWLGGFILYFALIGAMFDLDESDTWFLVISVFIVKVVAFVLIFAILMRQ